MELDSEKPGPRKSWDKKKLDPEIQLHVEKQSEDHIA